MGWVFETFPGKVLSEGLWMLLFLCNTLAYVVQVRFTLPGCGSNAGNSNSAGLYHLDANWGEFVNVEVAACELTPIEDEWFPSFSVPASSGREMLHPGCL